MKIYLAHNFEARESLKQTATLLKSLGHEVTSSWIQTEPPYLKGHAYYANMDLHDIDRADAILHFVNNFGEKSGKGKYIELGYAIAKEKRIFLFGTTDQDCVFYHLPQVIWLDSFKQLEKHLK